MRAPARRAPGQRGPGQRGPGQRGPARRGPGRVIAFRVFACLSAASLVCAFAVAALLPPEMDLDVMLLEMDPRSLLALHDFLIVHDAPGLWQHVLLPFLRRPGWLPPFMLGVIAGGIAFSLNHAGPTRQRTRRSG